MTVITGVAVRCALPVAALLAVMPASAREVVATSPASSSLPLHAPLRPQAADTVCYDGTLGTGPRLRRAVLALERRDGRFTGGVLDLHGRPVRTVPLRIAEASGDTLLASSADSAQRVSLRVAPQRDGNEVRGMLAIGRDTTALRLRPAAGPAAPLAWAHGNWTGTVRMGGFPVRLGAQLTPGRCGLLYGVLDSPDQGQTGLPLTAIRATSDSVVLEAGYLDLRLAISRGLGDERPAELVQRGAAERLTLTRGPRVTERRRPQEPARPFPYDEREVRFVNAAAGIRFEATLTLPRGAGPFPAVVLLSGSGPQDRDETVAGHRPFLVLSDYLTRRGFAVLRFDDRGAGGTRGSMLASTLEDLAADAAAALAALRSQPEVDLTRVGLVGHSEGGYVASMVATRDSMVRFLVLLAAPAAKGRDVLLAQRVGIMRAEGSSAGDVAADSLMWAHIFRAFDARPPSGELERRVERALADWRAALPPTVRRAAEARLAARTAGQDTASLNLWRSAWFQSLYHHDPAPALGRLRIPVLAVYGDLDLQVPPDQSVPALSAALHPAARAASTVVRLPGVNHMLQRARTGHVSEYAEIEETIAPAVLQQLGAWLERVAAPARPE